MTTIYIKPMTWAGSLQFYVGTQPSDPEAEAGYRLGRYFIVVDTIEAARAIAYCEAKRMQRLGHDWGTVQECPHYVGL